MAFGPGKDMFDSTRIIGEKQYNAGKVSYHVWQNVDCVREIGFNLNVTNFEFTF